MIDLTYNNDIRSLFNSSLSLQILDVMTFEFARWCSVGNKSSDSTSSIHIKPGECTLHARSCGAGIGMFL